MVFQNCILLIQSLKNLKHFIKILYITVGISKKYYIVIVEHHVNFTYLNTIDND